MEQKLSRHYGEQMLFSMVNERGLWSIIPHYLTFPPLPSPHSVVLSPIRQRSRLHHHVYLAVACKIARPSFGKQSGSHWQTDCRER